MIVNLAEFIEASGLSYSDINRRTFRWSDKSLSVFADICPTGKNRSGLCNSHQHAEFEYR